MEAIKNAMQSKRKGWLVIAEKVTPKCVCEPGSYGTETKTSRKTTKTSGHEISHLLLCVIVLIIAHGFFVFLSFRMQYMYRRRSFLPPPEVQGRKVPVARAQSIGSCNGRTKNQRLFPSRHDDMEGKRQGSQARRLWFAPEARRFD